ncbi:HD domain-containing phosphohydrolase [Bdellovibrio sp. BCCA]|uniref:HD domain-containing phosphohydrolase n=1 Tax=Bdellovibrio sp. BCCA TaxID=3136281 RepID=UPI0030F054DB
MRVLDLAIVSPQEKFRRRAENSARVFDFEFQSFESDDDFFTKSETYKAITCVLLDCSHLTKPNEIAGLVQVARQGAPDSYILAIASSKLQAEDARVIKTSGASLVMMENEYVSSSKLEFILSQVIRSAYIPIKTVDLIEGTEPPFPLYYLMPINKKFLKVGKPGNTIRRDFLEKYKEIGELYLRRTDLDAWVEYTNSFSAEDNDSLIRKCRLKFLQLNQSFLNLILLVTDQSSGASFAQGKDLYDICQKFAGDLLESLVHIGDPWIVISNSAIGDFGSVERAPAIAAYAGLLSSESKTGDAKEIMIGALLSDVGYLDLSPSTTQKIRNNHYADMNAEERMEYQKHPIYSLNQCLSRKLPLTESIKDIILQSHERVDQKGFPNKPRSDKLTEAAMLVRLCWDLDTRTQVRMGEARPNIETVKAQLAQTITNETGNYSVGFLMKMSRFLKPKVRNDDVIVV